MGNGLPFNMCCNKNKNSKLEDIDLKKNSDDNNNVYISYKTVKMPIKEPVKKMEINDTNKIKKIKTIVVIPKKNGYFQNYQRNSVSSKNHNISLINNTYQILNNTQQYISFPNLNFFKNNNLNQKKYRSYLNSKNYSSFMSRINSNIEEKKIDIKVKLLLTGDLFRNKIIEIDKNGMKNSLRIKHDNTSIFGYKNKNEENKDKEEDIKYDYLVDVKLPTSQQNKHDSGKVFEIILDKVFQIYILYYVHKSLLLYYKIDDLFYFELDKDYFLILGEIFLTINVKRDNEEKIINIKVEAENDKSKKYTFVQKDAPIKIGRIDCNINIQKSSISKVHCFINFEKEMYFLKDNNSTNGSTLLLKEDDFLKIKGEMNFKLEDSSFKIIEIRNESK